MVIDLPIITDDDAWLGLRDAEPALVRGRVTASGPAAHCIRFADWSELIVDGDGSQHRLPVGADVELFITRHEDGVATTGDAVLVALKELEARSARV